MKPVLIAVTNLMILITSNRDVIVISFWTTLNVYAYFIFQIK